MILNKSNIEKNTTNIKKAKYPTFFFVSLGFFIFSVLFQAYLSNKIAVKSSELSALYTQKQSLEKDIAALEYQDSVLSSMTNIENRALALGFTRFNNNVVALNVDLPSTFAAAGLR